MLRVSEKLERREKLTIKRRSVNSSQDKLAGRNTMSAMSGK